ncbi:hypothetical protein INT46_000771 [Mucor plumbeus]|uniref:Uncharacterized protein n=1 Tax=Mucor plumbeus TaxID=97098 RepID=A0A8H7QLW6_9FUNG|nr:hypothetical protein INT46_000771 [Mucor plumbeus]
MSLISTVSSLESAFKPPSLVFPSLHNNTNNKQLPKYSPNDSLKLKHENNNNEDLTANNQNLQSCIHYASRLIKLRSELRSPSYMNKLNSIGETGGGTIGQLFYKSNYATFGSGRRNSSLYELSSANISPTYHHHCKNIGSSGSSLLSEIGRAQSLPNVAQRNQFNYDKEDEREMCCHYNKAVAITALGKTEGEDNDDQDDGSSQLTYLSNLVRASLRRRQTNFHKNSDYLALPLRHCFSSPHAELRPRSISLRDMISEAIYKAIQPITNDNIPEKPKVLGNSQSFALASQLLYASQNDTQKHANYKKGHQHNEEKETLLLDNQQDGKREVLFAFKNKNKEAIDDNNSNNNNNNNNGVFDEKEKFTISPFSLSPITTNTSTCCQCNKHAIDASALQPTKSRDDKNLFSAISSDSESEDDESNDDDDTKISLSIHSFNRRIIQKRRLQKRPQALLVSISPSSAAAASVARLRRLKTKQVLRVYNSQKICGATLSSPTSSNALLSSK